MQENALFTISNGLYVLSAKDGNRYVGSLVDAITQVAVSPYLLVISCMNSSYTKSCIEKNGEIGISVLPQRIHPFIVANFGYQCSRDIDKWQNVTFTEINGLPYIPDALAKIRARVIEQHIYSNNTVFIAEVVDAFDACDGEPLTYKFYRDEFKIVVSKAFTTFKETGKILMIPDLERETFPNKQPDTEKHWVCTICSHVYDGEIPFEELPENWTCPLCGVGKELFEYR